MWGRFNIATFFFVSGREELRKINTRYYYYYYYYYYYCCYYYYYVDRNSAVVIATRYGLNGPRIECRWRRDLPHLSRPALGPTQPSVQWVPGLCGGVKLPGRFWPPTPSRAETKERVKLYLYSPSGLSWPVIGRNLALNFKKSKMLSVLSKAVCSRGFESR